MTERSSSARGGGTVAPDAPRGTLRASLVAQIPGLLAELGCEPECVLGTAGIGLRWPTNDDEQVDFRTVGRLLATCVQATGRADFGVLAGERFDPRVALDDASAMMLSAPTVGTALRTFVLHHHLNDSGAVPMLLAPSRTRAAVAYSVYWHDVPAIDVVYDVALAYAVRILRMLVGSKWMPSTVTFPHREPLDRSAYTRMFGPALRFDADAATVEFPASLLDRPLASADPVRYASLEARFRHALFDASISFADEVRRALRPMVLTGTASAQDLARLFSMNERLLRRRLEAEGTTVRALLHEAQFELAKQLLQSTRRSVGEVGAALGYANAAAFTRAFRGWAQTTPSEWRRRALRGESARAKTRAARHAPR